MSKLIYLTNTSIDGYIEDAAGQFDWTSSEQLAAFYTEQLRPMGTLLYGRRLYEMMAYWGAAVESYPVERRAFAEVWQAPTKVVFSRTMSTPTTPNTRIIRDFDSEVVRQIKAEASQDMTIGGAEFAAAAFDAKLIDECRLVMHPLIVGGGKPAFRPDFRQHFELVESRSFDTGAIYLRYQVRR